MFQMKRALPENRDDIQALWQAEFGDTEEFIDRFCQWCGYNQILLLWEEGEAVGLTAIPMTEVAVADGGAIKVGYIYAHTVRPDKRGIGYGQLLLNYADFCLQTQGAEGVVVVPAGESLFPYFKKSLFVPSFPVGYAEVSEAELKGAGADAKAVDAGEYCAIREEALKLPHVRTPLGLAEQEKAWCEAQGGGMFALELPGGKGCAAVERREDGSALVRELVCANEDVNAALAAIHDAVGAQRYAVRLPWSEGLEERWQRQEFGMLKWFTVWSMERWNHREGGHFGLALD